MDRFVPLARPSLGPEEEQAVAEVLRSGQLVQADRVRAFEEAVARRTGLAHAVACSSGTAALHLALAALDLPRGEEVLVPDFAFPACANAIEAAGLTPLVGDVRGDTWNLDLARAPRAAYTLAVDCFGLPADLPPEGAVVEDAACALGAERPTGWAGIVTVSFHPRKVITTGEGGMVLCRDAALAARVRRLRDHGREAGAFVEAGLNLRMSEVAAAIGLVQMQRLAPLLEWRETLAAAYRERLGECERLALQDVPDGVRHAWQTVAVRLGLDVDRDGVIAAMRARGIECGVAGFALHRLPYHAARYRLDAERFPAADALHDRGLALPIHGTMSLDDLYRVCDELLALLA